MPKILLTALLFTVLAALPAFAWDDVGHKITAYIAWQRMTPAARENVIRILRAAPEDAQLSTFYMNYGPEPEEVRKREFFELVATWADIIRDRTFETRYRSYHRSNWHYSDFFWKQIDGKVVLQDAPEEGGQALVKLIEFDKQMRDANVPDREKAIAIAWFMHLAGDIHQPLHTSARVTDTEPKGDQGGNLFLLTPAGTPREKQMNIHWVWDSIIGRNDPLTGDTCGRNYIEPLADKFMKEHPLAGFQAALKLGDYESWKKESFAFNNTDVFSADLKRNEMPSEKYKKNAYKVARRQLVEAGYRMGETFNAIFGAAPATAPVAANCSVIRKIMYPIHKLRTPENVAKGKPTLVLLDICPSGPAARPTIGVEVAGVKFFRTFDVVRTFETETDARVFATQNSIKDVKFDSQ